MKSRCILRRSLLVVLLAAAVAGKWHEPTPVAGDDVSVPYEFKLPFWGFCLITQGPNSAPTHLGRSAEAIDFAPNDEASWIGWLSARTTYPGRVVYAGWGDEFGNLVVIDHLNGFYSYYAHLDEMAVSVGDQVQRGWPIGRIGRTGNVYGLDGRHLHFEVRQDVNPSNVIGTGSPVKIGSMDGIHWLFLGDPWAEFVGLDVQRNGEVDIFDLARVVAVLDTVPSEPAYYSDADISLDGIVDVFDLASVVTYIDFRGHSVRIGSLLEDLDGVASRLQGTASLEIAPSQGTYHVGDRFRLNILLDTAGSNAAGVDLRLRYDSSVLALQDADPTKAGIQVLEGNLFASHANKVNTRAGEVRFSASDQSGYNGTGILASLDFVAIAPSAAAKAFVEYRVGSTLDSNVVETNTVEELLGKIVNASFVIAAPDTFETDDSFAYANPIGADMESQTHNFDSDGDSDWVLLETIAGATYHLFTSQIGADADTLLSLYREDGTTLLQSNDDFVPGRASYSYLSWTAFSSGIYYVKVSQSDGTSYGPETNYDLSVSSSRPEWANLQIEAPQLLSSKPVPGAQMWLQVEFENTEFVTATNTLLTVTIPQETSHLLLQIDSKVVTPAIDDHTLTFNLGNLGPTTNDPHVLKMVLELHNDTPAGRELIFDVDLSSEVSDPDPSDNSAWMLTKVPFVTVYLPMVVRLKTQ